MPTGWRPPELIERFPEYSVKDVYKMEKYQTAFSKPLLLWSWFQLLLHLFLMLLFFNKMGSFSNGINIAYTVFLFLSIFSFTSLMDRSILAPITESIKFALAIFIINHTGTWMHLEDTISFSTQIVIGYFILSIGLTFYFTYIEKRAGIKPLLVETRF